MNTACCRVCGVYNIAEEIVWGSSTNLVNNLFVNGLDECATHSVCGINVVSPVLA